MTLAISNSGDRSAPKLDVQVHSLSDSDVPLEVSDSNRKLPPAAMSTEDEAAIPRRNMICSTRLMLNDLWGKTIQGQFATYSRRQPVVDLSVTDISRFHDGKELIGIAPLFTRTVA